VLDALRREKQIALTYAQADGSTPADGTLLPFPLNPNGAEANIAGLCDSTGRVCGLMPHPERHLDATQHPHWTRRSEQPAAGDGLRVFQNAVEYFR
jgi:phosphoribosylformylglycinamidine synthase subunit PurQ / glutaminase